MIQSLPLSLSDIVSSCKENIVSDMGGEKVMLSIKNGNYYNLGHVGGYIWDGISEPISVEKLVESMTSEYSVDTEQCAAQTIAFLEQLRKEGLILVNEEATSTAFA
ncbi:lasso peptide biosynthesis PqqD family chaperone [Paenibacillus sp. strain BS8-2]